MKRLQAWILSLALIAASLAAPRAFAAPVMVGDFGAKGDGATLNTVAIQKAIDAAQKNGGVVAFAPGVYLTGSIFVKSGVTLRVDKGVRILGSQKLADYPLVPTRVAGIEMTWPAALVNVIDGENAAITGEGTIDGDGKVFWDSYWALRKQYDPRGLRWAADYDTKRPRLVMIYNSKNVNVGGGLLLRRSGFWTLHICYSTGIKVDGVTIRNNEDGKGPSTDGIDIDSSSHVEVAHADISVNDDDLCLKAGRDWDGLRVNRPTTDVVIHDSIIRAGAAGVTIGSETSGGFRNIEVYNITVMNPVPIGILFKSAKVRGGFAEDVRIHDMTMTDVPTVFRVNLNWNPAYSYTSIPAAEKDYPAYWTTLTQRVPEEKGIPHFRDVKIWNIHATGAKVAIDAASYPIAPMRNFELKNWDVQAAEGGSIVNAESWTMEAVKLTSPAGQPLKVKLSEDKAMVGFN
ncbi:MAG TPA: glycosyl hydrolase family 28 protein [Granulicella sp.]